MRGDEVVEAGSEKRRIDFWGAWRAARREEEFGDINRTEKELAFKDPEWTRDVGINKTFGKWAGRSSCRGKSLRGRNKRRMKGLAGLIAIDISSVVASDDGSDM